MGKMVEVSQYGIDDKMKDVTNILNGKIVLGRIDGFPVTNSSLGGDPAPGQIKMLIVRYSYMRQSYALSFQEGQMISLP